MPTPLNHGRKGKVVHTVETEAYQEDRVTAGMLINMSDRYFVDARHEFPEKGEKGKDGKRLA